MDLWTAFKGKGLDLGLAVQSFNPWSALASKTTAHVSVHCIKLMTACVMATPRECCAMTHGRLRPM